MGATKSLRTVVSLQSPQPGDLIEVAESAWYAVPSGSRVQVVEPFWRSKSPTITICPASQCRSFWGPHHGPATFTERDVMSTSGGPFKTIPVESLELEDAGLVRHSFWCWKDVPRANGGEDYFREVGLWKLKKLEDRYE